MRLDSEAPLNLRAGGAIIYTYIRPDSDFINEVIRYKIY